MANDEGSESGNRLRQTIEAQIERAKEERRRELFKRRIELAKSGVAHFKAQKHIEAVRAFRTYLTILEDWKAVPEGGLSPANFDAKKDLPEMLLISAVYWDLVTLYDRAHKPEQYKLFTHYLEKYVLFSKGLPHQVLAGETLRKFVTHNRPLHAKELTQAYKSISSSKCFIATALLEHIEEPSFLALRQLRDRVLLRSIWGRPLVRAYESAAPRIARRLENTPRVVRAGLASVLNVTGRVVAYFSED